MNGRAGTKKHGLKELENRPFLNRITRVGFKQGFAERPVSLISIPPLPAKRAEQGRELATPFALAVSDDDQTLVASAAASDTLFTVDAATGTVLGRVDVGAGPRGIALECKAGKSSQAWVLNALANTVSVIDLSDVAHPKRVTTITLEDPTHPVFKRGGSRSRRRARPRRATSPAASCHPDGHTDQLLWVLDTPIVGGGNQIMPRDDAGTRIARHGTVSLGRHSGRPVRRHQQRQQAQGRSAQQQAR